MIIGHRLAYHSDTRFLYLARVYKQPQWRYSVPVAIITISVYKIDD